MSYDALAAARNFLESRAAVPTTIATRQTSDSASAIRVEGQRRNLTKDGTLDDTPCRVPREKDAIRRHTFYMRR